MALECWSGPGLSQPLLYLRWSIEVTIAPRAFDFMAHPNDSQDDPEQDTRQHEPRPGVALPGLRLVPGACSIVHFRSILPNCPPTQLRIRREEEFSLDIRVVFYAAVSRWELCYRRVRVES